MTRPKIPRRASVLAALRECGPMTSQAIAEHLDWDVEIVTYTITTARRNHAGKMFRIVRHVPRVGAWGADQAVFSAAGGEDAERKPASRAKRMQAARKRHREKYLEVYRAKDRARKITKKQQTGEARTAINPWLQLADMSLRSRMGNAARVQ